MIPFHNVDLGHINGNQIVRLNMTIKKEIKLYFLKN